MSDDKMPRPVLNIYPHVIPNDPQACWYARLQGLEIVLNDASGQRRELMIPWIDVHAAILNVRTVLDDEQKRARWVER